jgi:hypothetical protein
MVCSMVRVQCGIISIPKDEAKLHTTNEIFRGLWLFESMFQVKGNIVAIIAHGKHEHTPKLLSTYQYVYEFRNYHGKPPASKIGPCSLRGKLLQFSMCQVCTASASIGGCSCKGGKTISFIASSTKSSEHEITSPENRRRHTIISTRFL